ncbi:phosphatase PAP2 family protein [Phaeovulum sp. W22_SRMD_FR3]|uniref:phosphatase PAP2 family protein n=1 Tax=Phaeovulum sp. W22_SRMD_FR3 TaxID=3240274 RepID=UPI003F9A6E63
MHDMVRAALSFAAHDPYAIALLAFLAAAAEAMVVLGALVPGTAIILALAALAGVHGSASLGLAITFATILGAVAGDGLAYVLGRRFGRGLFQRWPFSHAAGWLPRGEAFFARHGGKSVFWGRFVPGVKTVVPVLAGIAGMPVARFVLANVGSAVVWGVGLVLIGLGLGHGLGQSGLADPRAMILLALALVAGILGYLGLRFLVVQGVPWARRGRRAALHRLAGKSGFWADAARRVLGMQGAVAGLALWALIAAIGVLGFLAVTGQMLFDPDLSAADALISNAVAALRYPALDRVVVGVTMAGDGTVIGVLALAALIWVLACRQFRLAALVALAFSAPLVFVPMLKVLLARARPNPIYEGADSFSFPSGHASQAMVIFGVVALLIAQGRPMRTRIALYAAALLGAGLISCSRIYLGAHWPSDVAGGMLFGAAVVAGVAFFMDTQPVRLHSSYMALTLALVYSAAIGLHLVQDYPQSRLRYTYDRSVPEVTPGAWRAAAGRQFPMHRVTLEAEDLAPFIAQIAGSDSALNAAMADAGWQPQPAESLSRILAEVLPYGPLAERPVRLVWHDGVLPRWVWTRAVPDAGGAAGADAAPQGTAPNVTGPKGAAPQGTAPNVTGPKGAAPQGTAPQARLVLRFWPADGYITSLGQRVPLWLVDLSVEEMHPVLAGFGDIDARDPSPAERAAVLAALADLPARHLSPPGQVPQLLLLRPR